MRVVLVEAFGGPEVLRARDVADPVPEEGQVLLRVAAAGVNRADVLTRGGHYHRGGLPPLLLGLEAAGTIAAVGPGVSGFEPGQRVLAMGAANAPGFYAEQAAVDADRVVALPEGIDFQAAATLPTAWLSAWYCLHRLGRVGPGQTVLIHAAASGVGSAAVQIAAAAGARVIAAAGSAAKAEWVASLGADATIDSSALDAATLLSRIMDLTGGTGADVVLDTVGGDVFALSLKAVAPGGRVVALANVGLAPSTVDTRDFYPKNVSIHGFQLNNLVEHGYDPRPDLSELLTSVTSGEFHIPIDSAFALEEAGAAHARLETRASRGKIVLTTGA